MKRIAEPELMNEPAQVQAYACADFEQPHSRFIELLIECFAASLQTGDDNSECFALDLGCGPADISRRFARALPAYQVHAVDGAANMVAMADSLNRECGLDQRIQLFTALISDLRLPQAHYNVIFSNSLLHHLLDANAIWKAIARYSQPGTLVFVMDLLRPDTTARARELVETYAANETEILRQDFYHSLCAAYTIDEVQQQLHQCGMDYCKTRQVSDRHLIVYGITP
jgi:ubiquinone/menaquinone biosynthesis C-methylase UbiE